MASDRPITNVPITERHTLPSPDGKSEEEVTVWADGTELQVHREKIQPTPPPEDE